MFFRDPINGWVLLESHVGEDMIRLALATTSDGGHIWSFSDVPIPKQFPDELSGAVWVDFVDAEHGWVVLKNHTSSAFSTARLLQTSDGGNKWQELPQMPIGAPAVFVSATQGWLAGDSGTGGSGNMYRTRDGGKTWQGADLEAPSAPSGLIYAAYGDLHFADNTHGSIAVTFSPMSGQSTMVLFTTSDGGSTWKTGQSLRLPNMYNEAAPLSATVDSTLLLLRGARITALGTDNAEVTKSIGGVSPDPDFSEISFASATNGWLRTSDGKLLATTDGGQTLIWLVPGSAPRTLPPPRQITGHVQARALGPGLARAQAAAAVSTAALPANGLHYTERLEFDIHSSLSSTNMAAWWNSSVLPALRQVCEERGA